MKYSKMSPEPTKMNYANDSSTQNQAAEQSKNLRINPENWPTYISEPLGITFQYPPGWTTEDNNATDPSSAKITLIPPVISELGKYLPVAEKEKFAITISKWPEQEESAYILKDKNGVEIVLDPTFPANAIIYSKPTNKKADYHDYQMVYRQSESDPKIQFPLGYTAIQRDAWFLKGNGDVIYIKPGDFLGGDRKFYDPLLSTFVFNDQEQAKWEIYTSKEYGFSLRYPKSIAKCDITALGQDKNSKLLCVTTKLIDFQLDVASLSANQTLEQFVSSVRKTHTVEGAIGAYVVSYTNSPIIISGARGISSVDSRDEDSFGLKKLYLPLQNGKVLIVTGNNNGRNVDKISDIRFRQILDTLKLIQ
ncbi:MAG TPA: hypothetical protein VLG67_04090 [Candidatus Saccharimonadales bacterium]|nr:hypothetical protein [Candidatus Saccharimonadales bacterium]